MNKAQLIKDIEALRDGFYSAHSLRESGYKAAIRDVLNLIESQIPKPTPAIEILRKLQEFGESLTPEEKKQMFGE